MFHYLIHVKSKPGTGEDIVIKDPRLGEQGEVAAGPLESGQGTDVSMGGSLYTRIMCCMHQGNAMQSHCAITILIF